MPNTAELAELRRRVVDPMRSQLDPAIMADAFLTLASARGMVTRFNNLGAPAHRIGPATRQIEARIVDIQPRSEMQQVEVIRSRIPARIRAMFPSGGDAA